MMMAESLDNDLDVNDPIIKRCLTDPHITKQFDIICRIDKGEGGFGTVLKVRLRTDNKIYALKLIPAKNGKTEKILREAELLSSLQHRNIVRYYTSWMLGSSPDDEDEDDDENEDDEEDDGYEEDDGSILFSDADTPLSSKRNSKSYDISGLITDDVTEYIENLDITDDIEIADGTSRHGADITNPADATNATEDDDEVTGVTEILCIKMEFCERTLKDYMESESKRNVNNIERILNEIVDGLSYIHQKGIIHRDIKPANIFFDESNLVKIGDFGLSCFEKTVHAPETGNNLPGTRLYMAPEIRDGVPNGYDKNVDWFSVGVVLLELCYIFETGSHRIDVLSKIGQLPEDFDLNGIGVAHFKQKILTLLDHLPVNRLSAVQIKRTNIEVTWYEISGFCNVCQLDLANCDTFKDHVGSELHATAKVNWMKGNKGEGQLQCWCAVCQTHCSSAETLQFHFIGKQHTSKSQEKRNYYCPVCDLYTTGSKPFDQHLASKDHHRQVMLKEQGEEMFRCDICKKECTGPENLQEHCRSRKHIKRSNMNDGEAQSSFYCQHCEVTCNGIRPFEQHNLSKKHLKNVAETNHLQKEQHQQRFNTTINHGESLFYCQHCDLTCNGIKTFEQHNKSKKHLKNAATPQNCQETKDKESSTGELICECCEYVCTSFSQLKEHYASEMHKGNTKEQESEKGEYHCHICKIDCNSAETFEIHSRGQKHLRFAKRLSGMSDSARNADFCEMCKLQCTGPEPYRQHIAGDKHRKRLTTLNAESKI